MTEVVAALIWKGGALMICQRPPTKPGDCCGNLQAAR